MSAASREEPVWLKRHIEARRLVDTINKLKHIHVYTADEIIKIVGERYKRVKRRRPGPYGRKELELRRLETVFNTVYSKLSSAAKLPRLNDMAPFHRQLVESFVGDKYEEALLRVRRGLKLVHEFWREYRLLILSAYDVREATRYRREGSGRILSVVRRLKRELDLLRRVHRELLNTHVVSEGLPVVIVAGIPSSGKSTLVRRLSSAKPEVAPYPFTTKNIIVGKTKYSGAEFYIVDTPGILERPPNKQNEIERRAFAALASLPDVVVYLFDPSIERVQDIKEQLILFKEIYENIVKPRDTGLVIAVNKMDAVEKRELLAQIEENVRPILAPHYSCSDSIIYISALKGYGIDRLLEELYSCLRRRAQWLFANT